MTAYLILENGTIFKGESFGAQGEVTGEIAFTTGMGGYLETLTDPSYYGQIILQTFPLIGNYGIIPDDFESSSVAARGYIAKYPCENPSNFRSQGDLDAFLKQQGVVGLCNIDTRALTRIIREIGAMNGKIMLSEPTQKDIEQVKAFKIHDAVASVSGKYNPQQWQQKPCAAGAKYKLALMDFGLKRAIPEELTARGCDVTVFPSDATSDEILAIKPAGIMLSNGPGDPADPANDHIIETITTLTKTGIPMFGICIGHQFMAMAHGFKTQKLKFGHRGGNQPVKDTKTGKVYITSQNHGYAVIADDKIKNCTCSYINVNDGTCEGMDYGLSFSVQFHPEARSGPLDTAFLFDRFIERLKEV